MIEAEFEIKIGVPKMVLNMRKSILIAIILLCASCQNKQVSEDAPAKPAEPVVETNIADTTKDTLPEANSDQTQDQAASEPKTEEGSHKAKCGIVLGKCVCGSAKLHQMKL